MSWATKKIGIAGTALVIIVASMYGTLYHLSCNAIAGTEVSGHITTDTEWTLDGSPYIVVGDTFVDQDVTLTIEAGVNVLFNGSYYLRVDGRLQAWGSGRNMVVFGPNNLTPPGVDYWKGIVVENRGSIHLNYTHISYAVSGISIYSYYQDNIIQNSEIINNLERGILMRNYTQLHLLNSWVAYNDIGIDLGTSIGSYIDDSNITHNNIGVVGNYSYARIQNSNISDNAHYGILYEGLLGSTVSQSWYWNNTVSWNSREDPTGGGIFLSSAIGDTIGCNIITDNGFGLSLNGSYGVSAHHNDFLSNYLNAKDDQSNFFDDGTIGNYWDDYNGTDGDGDGIGDSPYQIDWDSADRYPSIYPFEGCWAVNNPPIANANGPYTGRKGWVIEFDGTGSYDPDGRIVEYEWDFGDGSPKGYGQIVNHTYSASGTYEVTLKVTDDKASTDNDTTLANVIDGYPDPPVVIDAVLIGPMLESVELSWSLSGDDGAGENDVESYNVYRGTAYDPDCLGYGLVISLPSGSDHWVDPMAGHTDPSTYFYCVAAIDNIGQESRAVQQASKFSRLISPGMVLISIPLEVSEDSVAKVFQTVSFQKIIYYDAMAGKRHNWRTFDTRKPYSDLLTIDRRMAVWVEVTTESYFTIAGLVPQETVIHLRVGWNLVGYPSFIERTVLDTLSVHYQTVESFDRTNPPWYLKRLGESDLMSAGEGYWIHVCKNYDWVLRN